MSDPIERQAAKEAYCKKFCHPGVLCPDSGFCREVDEAFDPVPSAQPEREKGEWTKDCACEICGFKPWYERDIHTLSFCPNCGADMREDQDG